VLKKISVACLLLISVFIFSCKKAGVGGKATLVVFMKHHDKIIPNHIGYPDTVFIKFNTKELPGTSPSDFDTFFIGEVGEDHIHCEELKPGNYYLYGVGLDTTISQRVKGGMPFTIRSKDKDSEQDINLAVTE